MADVSIYVNRIRNAAEEIARSMGSDLLEVSAVKENLRQILRIYIYDQGGVNINTCAAIARQINKLIDEDEMLLGDDYSIEVSSPGLDYKFKSMEHFRVFSGKTVKVKFIQAVEDIKVGTAVMNFNTEDDIVFQFTSEPRKTVSTGFKNISKCKLHEEIKFK